MNLLLRPWELQLPCTVLCGQQSHLRSLLYINLQGMLHE